MQLLYSILFHMDCKPQDQNLKSHLFPLFISCRSSEEKLREYQANSSCVIMSISLITTLFYKALILQGEIWCWSLLGLKGLIQNCFVGQQSIDRVQRKLILQLALWASCNQHLLARKSFSLTRKKFFTSRMKK